MSVIEALILGLIQGLTEFLPVSSSGHIELGKAILGTEMTNPDENLMFSIIVHAATSLSTLVVFRKDIGDLLRNFMTFKWNDSTQFVFKIVLSMVPAGVVGLMFKDQIEKFFTGNVLLVSAMLIITGLILFVSNRVRNSPHDASFKSAFVMGIAQAIAILPGISRSGATIGTGLLMGIDKERAARFSFLMVVPLILGATLLEVKDLFEMSGTGGIQFEWQPLFWGFIAAFFAGLVACKWMISIVKKSKLIYFSVYCFIAGAIGIFVSLLA